MCEYSSPSLEMITKKCMVFFFPFPSRLKGILMFPTLELFDELGLMTYFFIREPNDDDVYLYHISANTFCIKPEQSITRTTVTLSV
jgi:hypothetical protein